MEAIKIKKIIYNLILYILALIGFLSLVFQLFGKTANNSHLSKLLFGNSSKQDVLSASIGKDISLVYSFYADDDKDGLSNAEELIYGSNPNNKDTDKDSVDDGEEVKQGTDPLKMGAVPLSERVVKNYTIDYFSWLRSRKGIIDPTIDPALIDEFISKLAPENFELVAISDGDIRYNNSLSVAEYFDKIRQIKFPEAINTYKNIADGFLKGKVDLTELSELINSIELSLFDLKQIGAPQKTAVYHKKLIGLFTNFLILIKDLNNIYTDPVKIYLNHRKGLKLFMLAQELNELKRSLVAEK